MCLCVCVCVCVYVSVCERVLIWLCVHVHAYVFVYLLRTNTHSTYTLIQRGNVLPLERIVVGNCPRPEPQDHGEQLACDGNTIHIMTERDLAVLSIPLVNCILHKYLL